MILKGIYVIGLLLMATTVSAQDSTLKTPREKSSYAIGVNLIGNLRQQGIDIDLDAVVRGIKDSYSGGKLLMGDEDIRTQISLYQNAVRNKQARLWPVVSEENKKAGTAFLAENAKKEGVVTLPSGLQYRIVKAGGGKRPTDADTVEFHYRSSTIKGAELESSLRTGKAAERKIKGGVLPGLSEALKLMPVGSKWQLFIPPQLAYGERGSGSAVGPNETVIFEVELLAIK